MSVVWLDEDGYTRRVRIAPVAGVHPEMLLSIRPMTPSEVEDLEGRIDSLLKRGDRKQASMTAAAVLAAHVTEWNVKHRSNKDAAITPENFAKLPPSLFNKAKLLIEGARETSPRDDWSDDEKAEYLSTIESGKDWFTAQRGN